MKTGDGSAQIRRINRPGTSIKDFSSWPDESFEEMDSTLAVQQYIQQLIKRDPADIEAILANPEAHDEGVWKYEHLRQFCMELNGLAVRLQEQCFPGTCTQMTATEQWIFLCAAHKTPKECPAIDYTRHTLDGAACLLNSYKYFPSRVAIKETSVSKLGSVCRRVYRIFSHAYFHHRKIFDEFESQRHLCNRFTQFVTKYALMSSENLLVPFDDVGAGPDNLAGGGAATPAAAALAAGAGAAGVVATGAAAAAVATAVAGDSADAGVEVNNEVPGESDA